MLVIDKTEANMGGVYVVVDIVNWDAYIGETGDLNGRADNYRRDLERRSGEVNRNLQELYDKGHPLLWHTVLYGNNEKYKDGSDNYRKLENFYIAVFNKYGFTLCNDKQRDMTIHNMTSMYSGDKEVDFLLTNAEKALDEDYKKRFGYMLGELCSKGPNEKKEIWDKFIEKVESDIRVSDKSKYRISDVPISNQ